MSIQLSRDVDSGVLALTSQGRREAIYGLFDFSEHHNESRSHQVRNLNATYGALMRRAGPLTRRDLRPYFESAGTEDVDQRLFASFRAWWGAIGKDQLLALPGVTETDDGQGLRFDGIDTENADDLDLVMDLSNDALTVPLSALRNDPTTRARNALDQRVDPHSDEHEKVLDLFETIRMAGSGIEPEKLARRTSGVRSPGAAGNTPTLDEYTGTLSKLPGVREERINVTPEDVLLEEIETLADLDAARERIEATPTVVWRFDG